MLSDRTLVVVFLRGGADTLSLLAPTGDDTYFRLRPTLALRPADGLPLTPFHTAHPALGPLVPAFRQGRLAWVQGVGTDDTTGSHFEAQDRLEQGQAGEAPASGGWAGRTLRGLGGGPLSGLALGQRVPKSLRGAPAVACLEGLEELGLPRAPGGGSVAEALEALYAAEASVLGARATDTLRTVQRLSGLLTSPRRPPLPYPEGAFGRALGDLATILRAGPGVSIACLDLPGWDTHFVQPALLAGLARQLAGGLAAFEADLGELAASVTVLAVTEFGRRSGENGSGGTDHGRGFTALALGPVQGGVHGAWPGLEEEPLLPGPAGLAVTTDVRALLRDAVAATLGPVPADAFPGLGAPPTGVFAAVARLRP